MKRRDFLVLSGTLAVSCLTWGCGDSLPSSSAAPSGQSDLLQFGRSGTDQFFAEDRLGRIFEINPNRGLVRIVDHNGAELGRFTGAQRPYSVAFGDDEEAYLLDRGLGQVVVLDPRFESIRQFGQDLQGGTRILASGDEILILRANAGKILVFTRSGQLLRTVDLRRSAGLVTSLALDPSGELHLVRRRPLSIEKISAQTGQSLATYGQGVASAVRDISIDFTGRIALLDHLAGNVLLLDPSGRLIGSFTPPGSPGALIQPVSATFGPTGVLHIHTRETQPDV